MTYSYDGEGERVAKSTGKLYLFGTGSAPVVETDVNGAMTAEYVFFNGKRVHHPTYGCCIAALRRAER